MYRANLIPKVCITANFSEFDLATIMCNKFGAGFSNDASSVLLFS